ncbi:RNA polymerase sigma factor [Hymenobacter chitinivorans]|uniref:RNA polymerase sigma-70 factor (ECF subfamily) n=1 Tax=Hymenobacter chitinivorans DSM 11115 TaxID=1121954 RepID=A0A2M9B5X5_9BACT|nr:sigma-70 family RNA polymerase sigma factor [Hymenobacter chitinivorans]PJJ53345.1 RNA polymerase sigma-70 factor (ECF subfamily) [Hymenobacter chitinivorans DSM 11115]
MATLLSSLAQLSETDLLAECRRGNPRAQKVLYDRLAPGMLAVCLRYLRHQEEAEEALVLGFVRVFRALEQYRHEGSFRGWVRRILINEALGQLRRRQPLHLDIDDCHDAVASIRATAESNLDTADLLRLIQDLPAGYRTVFNLYAVEGYNHPEIAALLGISEGTSKSQLSKARALLQRRLASLHSSSSFQPQSYAA